MHFLIDTGSDVSVLPFKKNILSNDLILYAANNTPIRTFGNKVVNIDLNLKRFFLELHFS